MSSRVLTRNQIREFDRLAIHKYGIPGVVLMENAGRAVADQCLKLLPSQASVAILCGGGNNGGDGYVIARHLHLADLNVTLYRRVERCKVSGDADVHCRITERMGLQARSIQTAADIPTLVPEWSRADLLVDALLGTGFTGPLRSPIADIIRAVNGLALPVVAVDLPSGLDCDSGSPADPTIRAQVTVTFVAQKPGLLAPQAQAYLGQVVVAQIGAPLEICDEVGPP